MKKCGNSLDRDSSVRPTTIAKLKILSVPALPEFHQNIFCQEMAIAASLSTMPGIVWPSMRDSGSGLILLEDDRRTGASARRIHANEGSSCPGF